ncbi:response regulator [Kribbella sp. NPDC054772]
MTIRVLLVDDDTLLRAGLRMMLRIDPEIEVVGEAADGAAAIAAATELRPDVILMDVRMPGMDGVTATQQITATPELRASRIVVLTTFDADDLVRKAIGAGAVGYLVKDTPPAEIASAVRAVAAGHAVLSPAVTRPLLQDIRTAGEPTDSRTDSLTERELEVALAVAGGASNAEIAARLYVSQATVKAAISRILAKLDLTNRTQIAVIMRGER